MDHTGDGFPCVEFGHCKIGWGCYSHVMPYHTLDGKQKESSNNTRRGTTNLFFFVACFFT
jgi:hypothetical protein